MTGNDGACAHAVLVLMGGPDAERDVSLMSGRAVAEALREHGSWRVAEVVVGAPSEAELRAIMRREGTDVIFPVLHGRFGEGGPLQEMLEAIGVPYVGSRPDASRLAMDKLATKKSLVAREGARTPPARILRPDEPCPLEPPLVLKPVDDGSSVDMRICRTEAEVAAARAALHPRRGPLLAEAFVAGRELTVGIVGERVLPIIEIVPAAPFYDYDAKYLRDDTRYILEPDLPQGVAQECRKTAQLAYRRIGCRDIARADFMLDEEGAWFLEINTMPGFTTHSLVPMAAAHEGMEMPALCARLARTALERGVGMGASIGGGGF